MTRRKPKGNRWADHYTRRARTDGYAARSVYKLEEIQRRYRVIRRGDRVLDLGCAPGSWLKFAAETAGPGGRVVGVDRKPVTIALPPNATAVVGDLLALDPALVPMLAPGFQAVLSDMAPATTGSRHTDAARSLHLAQAALAAADRYLAAGGRFVCKIFQGEDDGAFEQALRSRFAEVKRFKPQSSRKASREIFVIGRGKIEEE